MRPRLTFALILIAALGAAPSFAATQPLERAVISALLTRLNLDDDETDSLPFRPHFAVMQSDKSGNAKTVAVVYRQELQLFTAEGAELAPVDGSMITLAGETTEMEALDLNADGTAELRLTEVRSDRTRERYYTLRDRTLREVAHFNDSFAFDLGQDGSVEVFVKDEEAEEDDELPEYAIYRWSDGELRNTKLSAAANEIVTDTAEEEVFQLAIGERGCSGRKLHIVRQSDEEKGDVVVTLGDTELARLSTASSVAEAVIDVKRPTPLRIITRGAAESRILLIVEEECVETTAPTMLLAAIL
jgi:hypothetical protein